jgi:osmoprotectant transport system ATP-binding protein
MSDVANNHLVQFNNVSFSHPAAPAPVISDLNLTVERGETLVLLGESGCGKTTTLKLVNRLLTPSTAKFGRRKATTAWDPIALRARIGYVIQEGGLFPHFTIARNVGLVPSLSGWDERAHERVRELLNLVGLDPDRLRSVIRANFQVAAQRVGVARALARIRRCSCSTSLSARSIPHARESCSVSLPICTRV